MRVIGLLSWYEESPAWLAQCVASAAKICDHLIAVDGPYALFPGATRKAASGSEQADIIAHTAAGAGMGCTIHTPRQPWWGNEVDKRDFMFRLGMTFAEAGRDWFLRIDADETLVDVPADVRKQLADTDLDVAEVRLCERGERDTQTPLRVLFRALPGIGIQQAHYVVTAPGENRVKVLAGNQTVHRLEPAEALWDVRLEHQTKQRTAERKALKAEYYAMLPDIEQVKEL
ncbi:hypothetical protein LXH13_06165 [Streptomyces spinosirectus]|uniref:hypothetical protein n=1 Tax=Streptomyces TaxID=1883 RepID=UPI001C9D9E93|nr:MULTISPECIES: hypothetical protein [Streptomyces]MBY8342010.1 hypothetical protein [Streptomyces plumbidurans]UIR16643.1 hypothetical protein LXH13_06165 [Streptomyces spinosirectus]